MALQSQPGWPAHCCIFPTRMVLVCLWPSTTGMGPQGSMGLPVLPRFQYCSVMSTQCSQCTAPGQVIPCSGTVVPCSLPVPAQEGKPRGSHSFHNERAQVQVTFQFSQELNIVKDLTPQRRHHLNRTGSGKWYDHYERWDLLPVIISCTTVFILQ